MTPDKAPIQPDIANSEALSSFQGDYPGDNTPIFDQLFLEWGSNPFETLPTLSVITTSENGAPIAEFNKDTNGSGPKQPIVPDILATDGLAKVIAAQVAGDYYNLKYGVPFSSAA